MVYNNNIMVSKYQPRRRNYSKLGKLLRDARGSLSVEDLARQLTVTKGFIYLVEQGKRKPKDSDIGKWASVYGVPYTDLWKCLNRIPMDLVASMKETPQVNPDDLISLLTDDEKSDLLPFVEFVRRRATNYSSAIKL